MTRDGGLARAWWGLGCALSTLKRYVAASGAQAARRGSTLITTVNVTAGKPAELNFTLSTKSVKRGVVIFKVKNSGALSHDFRLCSKKPHSSRKPR